MKRRQFLQKSGLLLGASLASPQIVKSQTIGLGGRVGANSRIGIGLIGNGLIMRGHRNYYLSEQSTEVLAVCDVDQTALKNARENVESNSGGSCSVYEDYEELLQRPDIDAVVVGTPDQWHAAISIAAMRAGKDVYVEKPMTLTIAESKAMVEARNRYGSVLQVGSQQRSDSRFRKAATMVRNGWIGDIKAVHVRLGEFPPEFLKPPEPVPAGFNYDKWLGPTPYEEYFSERTQGIYSGGWRRFWAYGSRKNGDWGAHHYDIVQWAFGMDHSGPTLFVPKGYQGEPYQYHQYANGVKVIRNHPEQRGHMIRFIGTQGEVMVSRNGLDTDPAYLENTPLGAGDERLYESDNHRANWLECIRTRGTPICNVDVGHHSCEICLLAGIAERLERPISWDPASENIVGDVVARRMMDRPRRAGYDLPA